VIDEACVFCETAADIFRFM